MKIKTLDAMYRGLPLVTTSTGAEGIELEHAESAMIADEASEFSAAISKLLSDGSLREKLSNNSRSLAKDKYTYAALAESMLNDINNLFE